MQSLKYTTGPLQATLVPTTAKQVQRPLESRPCSIEPSMIRVHGFMQQTLARNPFMILQQQLLRKRCKMWAHVVGRAQRIKLKVRASAPEG